MLLAQLQQRLITLGDPQIAKNLQRFFKTGPGEYGAGDIFLGLKVPTLRSLAQEYQHLSLADTVTLLKSPNHEARLLALFILIKAFAKADSAGRTALYQIYLNHTKYINNWDLVDASAGYIVGDYLYDKDRKILTQLAQSPHLWERRIAIVATSYFIKRQQYQDTLQIAEILLNDREDLIHKAVGWMLREVGKKDLVVEEEFLVRHYQKMPRTMLRYAIEKFSPVRRELYLKGKI